MGNTAPIEIQVAKEELVRINDLLPAPRLLIGGLAVQRYVVTRKSKDIDLVCDYEEARRLARSLYPSHEWDVVEVNDDAYRPSFHITHHHKPVGEILFGPKVTERAPYSFIDWDTLMQNATPYVFQGVPLLNIQIPCCSDLAYTKLISFLSRSRDKVAKRLNDLEDLADLSNHREFSTRDLLAMISRTGAEKYVHDGFVLDDNEEAIFSKSSIRRQASIFSPREQDRALANRSPLTLDQARELRNALHQLFSDNPPSSQHKLILGVCLLKDGGYGVRVDVICRTLVIDEEIKQAVLKVTNGYCEIATLSDVMLLSGGETVSSQVLPLRIGQSITTPDGQGYGSIGLFVRKPNDDAAYFLTCAHVLAQPDGVDPASHDVYAVGPQDTRFKIAEWFLIRPKDLPTQDTLLAMARVLPSIPLDLTGAPTIQPRVGSQIDSGSLLGQVVKKVGRSSGMTQGQVTAVDVEIVGFKYLGREAAKLDGLIEVTSPASHPFAAPGDSGSAVISETGELVGLVVASSVKQTGSKAANATYIVPIQSIMKRLNIELMIDGG